MANVADFRKVRARLKALRAQSKGEVVTVGYTQSYAIYVHENLTARHPVGQAKFLEQPAREHARRIAEIVAEAWVRLKNVLKSLLMGGLFLQRESQKLCPVDTGALKNSAFTREGR